MATQRRTVKKKKQTVTFNDELSFDNLPVQKDPWSDPEHIQAFQHALGTLNTSSKKLKRDPNHKESSTKLFLRQTYEVFVLVGFLSLLLWGAYEVGQWLEVVNLTLPRSRRLRS